MTKEKKEEKQNTDNKELPPVLQPEQPKENLKDLIEKNIKWTQVVYEQNRQIKHRLTMIALGSWLRLLIILVPIVLAFIYLPPILRPIIEHYSGLLDSINGVKGGSPNQLQEIINTLGGR